MPTVVPNFAPAVEAFTRGFVEAGQARQAREQRAAALLLEGAKADPTLFDSPVVQKQLQSLGLGKDEYELLAGVYKAKADPESGAAKMLSNLGLLSPEEQAAGGVGAAAQQTQQPAWTPYAPPTAAPTTAPATGGGGVFPAIARGLGFGGPEPTLPVEPSQPAPQPFAGSTSALIQRAQAIPGSSVKVGPKGVEVTIKGKTIEQAQESQFWRAVGNRQRELQETGTADPDAALEQSIREGVAAGRQAGILIPKGASDIADAGVGRRAQRLTRQMQKNVDMEFAAPLQFRTESGRRQAAQATPLTTAEATSAEVADASKGVDELGQPIPLSPTEQRQMFEERETARKGAAALATGRAGEQAREEGKAREDLRGLKAVSGNLKSFVPSAASILTSDVFKAKSGIQALRLYVKSGTGSPGIASLNVLRTLVPRFTKLIGGDVGNLAAQEQEPTRRIIDGTWQTAQEFVVGTLVMSLATERMAAENAKIAGVEYNPGETYRAIKQQVETIPELKTNPEMRGALDNFERTFGLKEDTRSLDDIYKQYGYGAPTPAAAPGTAP